MYSNKAVQSSKVTGFSQFQRIAGMAKLVLDLPHSNTDAERAFSMVGLNKTKTMNSLGPGWNPIINLDNQDSWPGAPLQMEGPLNAHQGIKDSHKPLQQGTQIFIKVILILLLTP